jgi:hypothetical protein
MLTDRNSDGTNRQETRQDRNIWEDNKVGIAGIVLLLVVIGILLSEYPRTVETDTSLPRTTTTASQA